MRKLRRKTRNNNIYIKCSYEKTPVLSPPTALTILAGVAIIWPRSPIFNAKKKDTIWETAWNTKKNLQKQIVVLTTSILTTEASEKTFLERVSCIWYSVWLQKDQDNLKALIDLDSKDNAMHSVYTTKLGLRVRKTNFGVQKIDWYCSKTFSMVIANFLVNDKLDEIWFFWDNFLFTNNNMKLALKIFFFTFRSANITFKEQKLYRKRKQLKRSCQRSKKWK